MSDYLTVKQVAGELQASERFVLDELRRKNMRGSRIGAGWRVSRSDLAAYVEAHANVSRVRGRAS